MFVGCTYTLKSNDLSILETGSPLKGIPPKTFAFKEFRDARPFQKASVKDPYVFYPQCRLDQLPTSLVAMVIRKELERNGHKCIAYSAQSNPDFIIEGSVYRFWVDHSRAPSSTYVAVKLTVNPVSPGKEMLLKTYEGKARWKTLYTWKTSLNLALLAMVKEMSTDPELIAFLEK
jgi:hypothetical protein